jgi:putative hydrolase of the HAD superfamily
MKTAVLFDLGNTLVHYFEKHEFQMILREAIAAVKSYLLKNCMLRVSSDNMWRSVKAEDFESSNYQVRPLEKRLTRIFQLDSSTLTCNILATMCRSFMKPIFARARCYEDTLPTLKELRFKGYKTAIVSNTTWGSPASLWREHLESIGLRAYFDVLVFCRDVGWRKPSKQSFQYTLEKLHVAPQQCVFIGDDPRWDIVGPKAVGIDTILVDRKPITQHIGNGQKLIKNLNELIEKLQHI